MAMLRVSGSNTAAIFVTSPTLTPLNSTGEPTDSPVIEPEKYITNVGRFWKNLRDPKTAMPATVSATAPTTNAPISVFLACLAMARPFAAGKEGEHPGIPRFGQELLRVSRGDHRLAVAVEEHRVVADGKDAPELVRHDHDGGPEGVAQIEGEALERELERGQRGDLRGVDGGELLERHGHVLRQGHRAPERAALVQDPEASQEPLAFGRGHLPEAGAGALVGDDPAGRLPQSDEVAEQGALSAPAPSHDDEDVALVHGEVEVLHDHRAAVGQGEIAHGDLGTRFDHRVAALFKCRRHRR